MFEGTDLSAQSAEDLEVAEKMVDYTPRKCLGVLPGEVVNTSSWRCAGAERECGVTLYGPTLDVRAKRHSRRL